MARAGGTITLTSNILEEEEEVSPLRTRQIMTSPMTTGIYMGKINTPHVVLSTMLNTKPVGTLFFFRMASLPRITIPGDLCPHRKQHGTRNKTWVYTQL